MEEVICVGTTINKDTGIKYYRLQNIDGRLRDVKYEELLKVMKKDKINVINMAVLRTKDNGDTLIFISDYYEIPKERLQYNLHKIEEYKKYENKQGLVGRIFDFEFNNNYFYPEILILKYYDAPGRREVTIPDFVDGFKPTFKPSTTYGAFCGVKHLEKIKMCDNVKGSLVALFKNMECKQLDLTEFDTSNVNSMDAMFSGAYIDKVIFSDTFNTRYVKNMQGMFNSSKIKNMRLPRNFTADSLTSMAYMFTSFESNLLDFGDNFDIRNVKTIDSLFVFAKIKRIRLGKNFNTDNINVATSLFTDCDVAELIVDKNISKDTLKNIKINLKKNVVITKE